MILHFLGRFHPLLVHLPIGVFFAAVFFKVYGVYKQNDDFIKASFISLKLSFFAALVSCISGYLLSQSGDYELDLVNKHQYFGIGFTIILGIFSFVSFKNLKLENLIWVLLFGGISAVGHLGGSLTHGESYLSFQKSEKVIITDIQKEVAYNTIVKPILKSKCYDCHSSKKTKGELRLDSPTAILKGGKNGACLDPSNAMASLMIKRMLLPIGDEEHMPPKGKPQPTEDEISLLKWWIGDGKASFTSLTAQIQQNSSLLPLLKSYENNEKEEETIAVVKPPAEVLANLKSFNIVAMPVGESTNFINLNILNKDLSDIQWNEINKISSNILIFKSQKAHISALGFEIISKFKNAKSIVLNYSNINNKEIKLISKLSKLKTLSLVGTNIDNGVIPYFRAMKSLQNLYIFDSKMNSVSIPNVKVDSGKYIVPTTIQDTMKYVF